MGNQLKYPDGNAASWECRAGVFEVDRMGRERHDARSAGETPSAFLVEGASLTRALPVVSAPRPPPNCKDSGLWRTLADRAGHPLTRRERPNHAGFGLIPEKRTTGLEPATFGLGSQRSTN